MGLVSLTLLSAGEEKRFNASLDDEEELSTLGEQGELRAEAVEGTHC